MIALTAGKLNGQLVVTVNQKGGKGLITGGSGEYAGAKGSFTFKNLNANNTRTSVVVTLA